jgi:SAM-dependent methyltransferase
VNDIQRSIDFGWIADKYVSARGGQERIRQTADLLENHLDQGSIILDIGAGPAQIASNLPGNSKIICLDISHAMTKVAAEISCSVIQADAQHLPLAANSVDAALMLWVLNHVANPEDSIREVHRVLHAKGRLLYLSGIPTHPSWDILGNMLNRLDNLRQASVEFEGRLTCFAESIGLRILHDGSQIVRFRQRPRGLAKRIQDRSYGHLRHVDEETWERTVVPLLETLNRLPKSDSYYERENKYSFIVFEKRPKALWT